MLLDVEPSVGDSLAERLDKLIFRRRPGEERHPGLAEFGVHGPRAAESAASVMGIPPSAASIAGPVRQCQGARLRRDGRARRCVRRNGVRRLHAGSTPPGFGMRCSAPAPFLMTETRPKCCGSRRPAAVQHRHGYRHDSARGRHRGSRHQLHQGLLRGPGGDRPRPTSRSRPHCAQAGGAGHRRRRCPARGGDPRGREAARSCDQRGDVSSRWRTYRVSAQRDRSTPRPRSPSRIRTASSNRRRCAIRRRADFYACPCANLGDERGVRGRKLELARNSRAPPIWSSWPRRGRRRSQPATSGKNEARSCAPG